MTQAHKTPGNLVKFKDKVFEEGSPWYPYFNEYQGHYFQVLDNPYPGHVLIRCESGLMSVKEPEKPLEICIHDDEIMTVSPTEKKKIKMK
jgi:hypothetical protein